MYLAEHKKLKDYRAIKCISKTRSTPPSLLFEADLLKNLKHPGIPTIYDVEEDEMYYYIVEEYVQGISLQKYNDNGQSASPELILDIAIQLCEILAYLHEQSPEPIVYLDLKPEHIMISHGKVYLLDYGMASRVTATNQVTGRNLTEPYAAPEKRQGKNLDARTDIYELGSVLYELINDRNHSGRSKTKNPHQKKILKKLLPILSRMRQQNPQKRYQTMREVLKQLQVLQEEKGGRHLYSDIYILGSTGRIGTTHLAVSLVSYLNSEQAGYAMYFEENDTGYLRKLADMLVRCKDEKGIITYGYFEGLPSYGESVQIRPVRSCIVHDLGSESKRLEDHFTEKGLLIYVMDGSYWLWPEAAKQLPRFMQMFEVKVVGNCEDKNRLATLEQYLGCPVYGTERLCDPFLVTESGKQFWEKLLSGEGGL